MNEITVNDKIIGDGHQPYIVAEIGINHNGDVVLAKEMVAAAWEAKADAVKIQTFITKDFLHPSHPGFKYDILAEISHEKEQEIWDFARQRSINLFSTPEDIKSLVFIKRQKPALIKIAAMDFNYKELIQAAASLQKPILLSSGMSTLEEVLQAVRWANETGNHDYIVLHCVSCYPAPPEACNLSAIPKLKCILDCPVGFSDHTKGIHISLAAVALGANIIEKHFTIDKNRSGPDQECSMDPNDLRELVACCRDIENARGNGCKEPALQEYEPRRIKRRGIYASRDLECGTVLKREHVVFFAPSGEASHVTDWPLLCGRPVRRNVRRLEMIRFEDVSDMP